MFSAPAGVFPSGKRSLRPARSSSPLTWVTRQKDFPSHAGLDFGILRLPRGTTHALRAPAELVAVLLHGKARLVTRDGAVTASRRSVFEQGPFTLSLGRRESAEIHSVTASEWAIVRTDESAAVGTKIYPPALCDAEDRGAGLAQGACRRLVRTIFDHPRRPDSAFVIGEVINLPGRWSSYPPHHHPQPEIYHYRFTAPQGYGHAEIGREVHRVENGDTTFIPGGLDHAQVSAPGYGMYYLWIVRHLPAAPYLGFTISPEHAWLLDPQHQGWNPSPTLFP